ncbi:MAG: hypothetical protein FJ279_33060, partial [Planctomycetes bacterium]|nr:hypothetical protein [Planctomycetota bacterium]
MDPFLDDVAHKTDARLQQEFDDFQLTYSNELETYLVNRVTGPAVTWKRNYSSVKAYLKSVAPNRERWRAVLGCFEQDRVR